MDGPDFYSRLSALECAAAEIRSPRIRYLSAVDAVEHADPDDIRALLVRQLSSAVRWTATVTAMSGSGVTKMAECGPGGVLAGLMKRIERRRETQIFTIEEPESFQAALTAATA
jgi:[acyl-carrier-protein] S-malonyltransferase